MSDILEIFGHDTECTRKNAWKAIISSQACPFIKRKCFKVRKSQPDISIGTCSLSYGRKRQPIMICPLRLLERHQIFTDAIHLLTLHEPGNELHIVSEISVPGGSVDYFLVSARKDKPIDFVGIELQTLDTTGTVWPARERFLMDAGLKADENAAQSTKSYGMNWKMTAKTILVQLHHKVETVEHLSKHLVLVAQDCLLNYMRREFSFDHLESARSGDAMHFHSYSLERTKDAYSIILNERYSTDALGVSKALGLQAKARVELDVILSELENKISAETVFQPV